MSTEEKEIEKIANEEADKVLNTDTLKAMYDVVNTNLNSLKENYDQLQKEQEKIIKSENINKTILEIKRDEMEKFYTSMKKLEDKINKGEEIVSRYEKEYAEELKKGNPDAKKLHDLHKNSIIPVNNLILLKWETWNTIVSKNEHTGQSFGRKVTIDLAKLPTRLQNVYFLDVQSNDYPKLVVNRNGKYDTDVIRCFPINRWKNNLLKLNCVIHPLLFNDVINIITLLSTCYDILQEEQSNLKTIEGPILSGEDSLYYVAYAFTKTEIFSSFENSYEQYVMLNMIIFFHLIVMKHVEINKISEKEFLEETGIGFTTFFGQFLSEMTKTYADAIGDFYIYIKYLSIILQNSDMEGIENYDNFLYYFWISSVSVSLSLQMSGIEENNLYKLNDLQSILLPSQGMLCVNQVNELGKIPCMWLFQFTQVSAPYIHQNLNDKLADGEFYTICTIKWKLRNSDKNDEEYLEEIMKEGISDYAGMFLISLCFTSYTPYYLLPMYIEYLIATKCKSEAKRKQVRWENYYIIRDIFFKRTKEQVVQYTNVLKKVISCFWGMRQTRLSKIEDDIIPTYADVQWDTRDFILDNKFKLQRWHTINYQIKQNEFALSSQHITQIKKAVMLEQEKYDSFNIDEKYRNYQTLLDNINYYSEEKDFGTLKYSMTNSNWIQFLYNLSINYKSGKIKVIRLEKNKNFFYKEMDQANEQMTDFVLSYYWKILQFEETEILTGHFKENPHYDKKLDCITLFYDGTNYFDVMDFYHKNPTEKPDLTKYSQLYYRVKIYLPSNLLFENHLNAISSIKESMKNQEYSIFSPLISLLVIPENFINDQFKLYLKKIESLFTDAYKALSGFQNYTGKILLKYSGNGISLETILHNYVYSSIYLYVSNSIPPSPYVVSVGIFLISMDIRNINIFTCTIEEMIEYSQEIMDLGYLTENIFTTEGLVQLNHFKTLYNKEKLYNYFINHEKDYIKVKDFLHYSKLFLEKVEKFKLCDSFIKDDNKIQLIDNPSLNSSDHMYGEIYNLNEKQKYLISTQQTKLDSFREQIDLLKSKLNVNQANNKGYFSEMYTDNIILYKKIQSLTSQLEIDKKTIQNMEEVLKQKIQIGVDINDKLTEIENSKNIIKESFDNVSEIANSIKVTNEEWNNAKNNLIGILNTAETKNKEIKENVEKVKKLLDSDGNGKLDLLEEINKVNDNIDEIKSGVSQSGSSLKEISVEFQNKDSQLNKVLNTLEAQCNSIKKKKEKFENELTNTVNIQKQLDELENKMIDFGKKGKIPEADIKIIKEARNKLDAQKKKYDEEVTKITVQLEELTKMKETIIKDSEKNTKIITQEYQLEVEKYKKENQELQNKMERIKNNLQELSKLLTDNMLHESTFVDQIMEGQNVVEELKNILIMGIEHKIFDWEELRNKSIKNIIETTQNKILEDILIMFREKFSSIFNENEKNVIPDYIDGKLENLFKEVNLSKKIKDAVEKNMNALEEYYKIRQASVYNDLRNELGQLTVNNDQYKKVYNNLAAKINSGLSKTVVNLTLILDNLLNICYDNVFNKNNITFFQTVGKPIENYIINVCQELDGVINLSDGSSLPSGMKSKSISESYSIIRKWLTTFREIRKDGNQLVSISNLNAVTTPNQLLELRRKNESMKREIIKLKEEIEALKPKPLNVKIPTQFDKKSRKEQEVDMYELPINSDQTQYGPFIQPNKIYSNLKAPAPILKVGEDRENEIVLGSDNEEENEKVIEKEQRKIPIPQQ